MRLTRLAAAAALTLGSPLLAAPGDRSPATTYAKTCGYCHGRNVGPVILGRGLDPGIVALMVRHGQNGMPAFRPTEVTPGELAALATWIAASKTNPAEAGH